MKVRAIAAGAAAAWLAIGMWLAAAPRAGAAPPSLSLEAVLKQLDEAAKRFRSLTAEIERTKVTVAVNDRSVENGRISVRRDDKMRIEMLRPDPHTILRTGDELYLFNPRAKRVEQYDLGKHRALVDQFLLLGFGTSASELKKGYLLTLMGEESLDNKKTVLLELTPKSDAVRKQLSKIQLWIDQATWLPIQQEFFEGGSSDYFIVHYTNVVVNPKLSDSQFKPHWPKGVNKIKPQS